MLPEAICHSNEMPYIFPIRDREIKLRIRVSKRDQASCFVVVADRFISIGNEIPIAMERCATTRHHEYFECAIQVETRKLRYQFLIVDKDGEQMWYGERGASHNRADADFFQYSYICDADIPMIPSWVQDAVVYQIFPDRFYRTNPSAVVISGLTPWSDDQPSSESLYGGNLAGILEKIPYLADLGVNTIYLNPIFESPSNHKYDTTDYYRIDPGFGDEETFIQLVKAAHSFGIRVLLDAVFNHSGDRFFAFRDLLEKGEQSNYRDWYIYDKLPLTQEPVPNYETFGIQVKTMPKLNTNNPDVVNYFIKVALYWIDKTGIDGWRLDVANEVDHKFWRELRNAVKSQYPEAILIGEVMHYAGPWLQGDQFDGAMNYTWRESLLDFFARQTVDAKMFVEMIDLNRMSYSDQAMNAMMQLLGSHDTERFLTACHKSAWGWQSAETARQRMKLAVCFQLAFPGMPTIYYGDELGMEGASDPDCRRPMIWEIDEANLDMLAFYKKLIRLRRGLAPLQYGDYRVWFVDNTRSTFGFIRSYRGESISIIINRSPNAWRLELPNPRVIVGDASAGNSSNTSRSGITSSIGNTANSGEHDGFFEDLLTGQIWQADNGLIVDIPAFGCAALR